MGIFPFKEKLGNNVFPGYILIRETSSIPKDGGEGIVHGDLVKSYFGLQPSVLKNYFKAIIGGFAIMEGTIKVNSGALNSNITEI